MPNSSADTVVIREDVVMNAFITSCYKAFHIINGRYINRHLDIMSEYCIYKVRYRYISEINVKQKKLKNKSSAIHPLYHIKLILYHFRKI